LNKKTDPLTKIRNKAKIQNFSEINGSKKKNISSIFTPTLVIAILSGFLFMNGWAYVSNWYAYYGLSANLIKMPIQQIFIRSLPAIFINLFWFFFFMISYLILRLLINLFSLRKPLSSSDISIVLVFTIIISYFYQFSLVIPDSVSNLYEFAHLSSETFHLYLLFQLRVLILLFLVTLVPVLITREARKLTFSDINQNKNFYRSLLSATLLGLLLLNTLSYSALYGIMNAANGTMDIVSEIPIVMLVTPKKLYSLTNLEKYCHDDQSCEYGPFGLIYESENAYYLIKWDKQGEEIIQRNPGIYVIQRTDTNGANYLIPVHSTPTKIEDNLPSEILP